MFYLSQSEANRVGSFDLNLNPFYTTVIQFNLTFQVQSRRPWLTFTSISCKISISTDWLLYPYCNNNKVTTTGTSSLPTNVMQTYEPHNLYLSGLTAICTLGSSQADHISHWLQQCDNQWCKICHEHSASLVELTAQRFSATIIYVYHYHYNYYFSFWLTDLFSGYQIAKVSQRTTGDRIAGANFFFTDWMPFLSPKHC